MNEVFTIQELAAEKKISSKTVWRWVKHGYGAKKLKLYATRVGHQFRVNRSTWENFLYKISQ